MKTKSSAKASSKSTKPTKSTKIAVGPTTEGGVDLFVATLETRLLEPAAMRAKRLLAAMRMRITPEMRAKLEAEVANQPTVVDDVGTPVSIYTSESIGVAVRVEWHQEPRDPIVQTFAAHKARMGGDVGPEIVYLVDQARLADSMVAQGRVSVSDTLVERARGMLTRLRSAVELVVDDEVRDDKHKLVEALRRAHDSVPANIPALASALAAYVDVCRVLCDELSDLDGFEPAMVDEAAEAADILSARTTRTKNLATRSARLRRNRLLDMIRRRIAKIRKVARFAFATYPDVVRELFSAYNRELRRAQRNRGAAKGGKGSDEPDGLR